MASTLSASEWKKSAKANGATDADKLSDALEKVEKARPKNDAKLLLRLMDEVVSVAQNLQKPNKAKAKVVDLLTKITKEAKSEIEAIKKAAEEEDEDEGDEGVKDNLLAMLGNARKWVTYEKEHEVCVRPGEEDPGAGRRPGGRQRADP